MSGKTTYHYPDGSITFDQTLIVTGSGTPSRIEQLIRGNAALREALTRADLALDNLGIGKAAPVRVIARNALGKEAQP